MMQYELQRGRERERLSRCSFQPVRPLPPLLRTKNYTERESLAECEGRRQGEAISCVFLLAAIPSPRLSL